MPNKRISELSLLTTPQLGTMIPVVENGQTQKLPVGTLLQSGLPVSASSITATSVHVEGNITADSFTVVSSSIIYATGSTNFGDSFDDFHTFTGSVTITGSTTITGSVAISGSSSFVGNHILSGTTVLTGNTIISGNFEVSGSTILHNSIFVVTGSQYLTGSQWITGSLSIYGDVNVVSGSSFYRWGNKLFNYGAFYDTTTQSGSVNVSQSIQFNSTDYSNGVSISNKTRVVLENIGVYNMQFSAQIVDAGAGDSIIHIWIKKNGVNVPNSAGRVFLQSNKETISSWNYIVPATTPNDYYELVWQSTDADARILYQDASGNIPAIPSIILTVSQVA
jgi:hypothetical protein